jgi:hypothetical protein
MKRGILPGKIFCTSVSEDFRQNCGSIWIQHFQKVRIRILKLNLSLNSLFLREYLVYSLPYLLALVNKMHLQCPCKANLGKKQRNLNVKNLNVKIDLFPRC